MSNSSLGLYENLISIIGVHEQLVLKIIFFYLLGNTLLVVSI